VEGVTVRFDGHAALAGVDFHASPGERVALLGPNGAGKTTLLNAICGLVRPARGQVVLFGERIAGLPPHEVARRGVGRTFQTPRLFGRMTAAENLRAGRALDPGPWLEWAGLDGRRDDLVEALTPAESRRLELARAVAAAPAVLLLDEPCGGLTPGETDQMTGLLRQAAAPDRITLVVEHKLSAVARLCSRAVVLHLGQKIYDGPVEGLQDEPRVLEAYLGRPR
jgi:branched-chain amino acid transport system ATP-binding protein